MLVELTGLEPVTPTMSTWYSNQLSYNPEAENDISMKQGDLQAAFEHFVAWVNCKLKFRSLRGPEFCMSKVRKAVHLQTKS